MLAFLHDLLSKDCNQVSFNEDLIGLWGDAEYAVTHDMVMSIQGMQLPRTAFTIYIKANKKVKEKKRKSQMPIMYFLRC